MKIWVEKILKIWNTYSIIKIEFNFSLVYLYLSKLDLIYHIKYLNSSELFQDFLFVFGFLLAFDMPNNFLMKAWHDFSVTETEVKGLRYKFWC